MKKPVAITLVLFLAAAGWVGWLAWRASKDLVTLHVRNMPIDQVIRKIRWQTWESFTLHKDLKADITIDVDDLPLEEVLDIFSQQAELRWTTVYPVYLRKKSLASLDRALRGEIEFSKSSFTNYQSRGFGGGGGRGGGGPGGFGGFGGEASTNSARLVSLSISNKDLTITAQALSRFGPARVVPENGASVKLNLELSDEPLESAIGKVASQARRSWTKLYALQPERGGRPGGDRPPGEGRDRMAEIAPEMRERGRERAEQMLEMLPPEQRQQMDARREEMQALQSLPAELRQQAMSERMNSPEAQARADQRQSAGLKNSTAEQRRDRYQQMYERRKAREAGQGGPRPAR